MQLIVLVAVIALTGEALCAPAVLANSVSIDARAASQPPLVAAAASVRFALVDLADRFERQTRLRVRLAFGSSGNLARQIRQGAPYALYLAADPYYEESLVRDGLTRSQGKDYLLGRLAIIVPSDSPLTADGSLEDLRAALSDGRLKRFAIANPEHAPYGKRAEQVLRHAGLWEAIGSRLLMGENVGQAAQFAVSGNAEGGIIASALAQPLAIAEQSSMALIPQAWHQPLRHRAVLLKTAGPIAEQFYDYLSSTTARDVFQGHGFSLPGNSD